MSKRPFKSKTLWFNALAGLVAISENFGYTGVIPDELAPFIPAAVAGINLVLRYFFTSQGLRK